MSVGRRDGWGAYHDPQDPCGCDECNWLLDRLAAARAALTPNRCPRGCGREGRPLADGTGMRICTACERTEQRRRKRAPKEVA